MCIHHTATGPAVQLSCAERAQVFRLPALLLTGRAIVTHRQGDSVSVRRGCSPMTLAASTSTPRGAKRSVPRMRLRCDVPANHWRVARVMRIGRVTRTRVRRYYATTDSDHESPVFGDLYRELWRRINSGHRWSPLKPRCAPRRLAQRSAPRFRCIVTRMRL